MFASSGPPQAVCEHQCPVSRRAWPDTNSRCRYSFVLGTGETFVRKAKCGCPPPSPPSLELHPGHLLLTKVPRSQKSRPLDLRWVRVSVDHVRSGNDPHVEKSIWQGVPVRKVGGVKAASCPNAFGFASGWCALWWRRKLCELGPVRGNRGAERRSLRGSLRRPSEQTLSPAPKDCD